MPDVVTLTEAKAFLRVEHADQDAMIQSLLDTATEHALDYADGLDATDLAMSPPVVPDRIRTAILIHTLTLYDAPDGYDTPKAVYALLHPFRLFGG